MEKAFSILLILRLRSLSELDRLGGFGDEANGYVDMSRVRARKYDLARKIGNSVSMFIHKVG